MKTTRGRRLHYPDRSSPAQRRARARPFWTPRHPPHNWRKLPQFRFGDPYYLDLRKPTLKFACFACHKSFSGGWDEYGHPLNLQCCPECQGVIVGMGPIFRAPPKRDKRAWKRLWKYIKKRRPRSILYAQQRHEDRQRRLKMKGVQC